MVDKKWIFIGVFLLILFIFVSFVAGIVSLFVSVEEPLTGNTVVIPIKGIILSDQAQLFGEEIASSTEIVKNIEKADEAENVKAIIFEINSGGGTVVASEEIVDAVKNTDKPTVAYIREIGASGAYWIASATDHIIASRMSITGSVGVIGSYLEFSGFLERYNVTYQRLVSGRYKDLGSPFKKLSYDEESLFQKQLDLIHDYFLSDVIKNRNISEENIDEIESAQFFLGIQAKELGLIDEFGSRQEAIEYIEKKLNITADVNEMTVKKSIFDVLGEVMNEKSFFVGKGIGSALIDKPKNKISIWS